MLQLFRRLWELLTLKQRRRLLLQQLVSIAMAFASVLGISAVMPFFAVLAEPDLIQTNHWLHWMWSLAGEPSNQVFLWILGGLVILATVLASVINFAGTTSGTRFAFWVGADLQTALFAEYLSREYLFHVRTNTATLVNNTLQQVNRVVQGILLPFVSMTSAFIAVVAILAATVVVNPVLALAAAGVLSIGFAVMYLRSRGSLSELGEVTRDQQRRQLKRMAEGLGSFREMRLFRAEAHFLRGFERTAGIVGRSVSQAQVLSIYPKFVLESVAIVGLVVVALLMTTDDAQSGQVLSQLGFVAVAAYRLMPSLQALYRSLATVRNSRSAFDRVWLDLKKARQTVVTKSGALIDDAWRDRPSREIEFRDVTFRYSKDGPAVVSGLSLRIPVGAMVAFVGSSGSGKTTAIDLLLGLLEPESGSVLVDGEPISAEARTAWQACLTFVPQQIYLLDASIAENVAFGQPKSQIDRARVEQCLRSAELGGVIDRDRLGIDAGVGERGARLSGGQRQRLGIARALYRCGRVMVLDEATSALDGITEASVIRAMTSGDVRRTVVMVAHRLTTVRGCDVIFEFDGGRVVNSGTFEELLVRSPRFRSMAGEATEAAGS